MFCLFFGQEFHWVPCFVFCLTLVFICKFLIKWCCTYSPILHMSPAYDLSVTLNLLGWRWWPVIVHLIRPSSSTPLVLSYQRQQEIVFKAFSNQQKAVFHFCYFQHFVWASLNQVLGLGCLFLRCFSSHLSYHGAINSTGMSLFIFSDLIFNYCANYKRFILISLEEGTFFFSAMN